MKVSMLPLLLLGSLLLTLAAGCGLSDVGPERDKLARWRQQLQADAVTVDVPGEDGQTETPDVPGCDLTVCEGQDRCAKWRCSTQGCVNDGSKNCDDENPCTTDACDPKAGCQHTANTDSCSDGDACVNAICSQESCIFKAKVDCDDGNACTDDSCDKQSGCGHQANTAPCDDGSVCTTNSCAAKKCAVMTEQDCHDTNPCTDDSCDPKQGCQHANNQVACDDGKFCTAVDVCGDGTCSGLPALFDVTVPGKGWARVPLGILPLPKGRMLIGGARVKPSDQTSIVGAIWQTDGAGKGTATTLQIPKPQLLVIRAFVALPGGVTAVLGGRWGAGAWLGKLSPGGQQVDLVEELSAANENSAWMTGVAMPDGTLTIVGPHGVKNKQGGYDSTVVVQFRDAQFNVLKTESSPSTVGSGSLVVAVGSTQSDSVYLCGDDYAGPWLARPSRSTGFGAKRGFGVTDARCSGLAVLPNGDLFAVGSLQKGHRAAWWRLRPNGAVVAKWQRPDGQDSTFSALTRAPDGSLLVAGLLTPSGKTKSRRLVTRFHRDLVQRWEMSLPGAGQYDNGVLAWHPAGYVISAGTIESVPKDPKKSLMWVAAMDPWGHLSCEAAGECQTIGLADCAGVDSCTTAACDAKAGCQKSQRAGGCDDGQACTTGGQCAQGSCKPGNLRFWQAHAAVKAGAKSTWLAVDQTPAHGGVAATLAGTTRQLQLVRVAAGGKLAWSKTLTAQSGPPSGAKPRFLVATGGNTWVGGGVGGTTPGGWLVGVDNSGAPIGKLNAAGETSGWVAGTATAGGFATVGRIKLTAGIRATLATWSAAGKQLSQISLTEYLTQQKTRPVAITRRGKGLLVLLRDPDATASPLRLLGIDANGTPGPVWLMMGAKAAPSGLAAAQLFDRGDAGVAVLFGQQTGKDPVAQVLILTTDGVVRNSATPVAGVTNVTRAAALLNDQGLAMITMPAPGQAAETALLLTRSNRIGAAAGSATVTLPNFKATNVAMTATPDGALLLAARGTAPLTGMVRLELRRMSPWGHQTCKEAGKCGVETAQSCTMGDDCQRGRCDAKLGCVLMALGAVSCDGGDPCVGARKCVKGTCAVNTAAINAISVDCDDGDPCTADSCKSGVGCQHLTLSGGNCGG